MAEQAVAGSGRLEAEDVTIGQVAGLLKKIIRIFEREVEAPEIAVELIGGILFGSAVDDAELEAAGTRGWHAGESAEAEGHGFVQSVQAAVPWGPWGGHAGNVEGFDGGRR